MAFWHLLSRPDRHWEGQVEKFDENLPEVINQINQLSYKTFNDLPRGDQKCKSMRKLAGRTLIDILPPKLTVYLEDKFGDLNKVPDFYDMVGQLSYYGKIPDILELFLFQNQN